MLLLITPVLDSYAKEAIPKAVKGVFDLREIENVNSFMVKLNGEWEFYWKKVLLPSDFQTGNYKPDYFGKVPSYWSDYPQDAVKTDKKGFATYRLIILLPHETERPLAIDIPVFDSSYDIYVNGKYFGGNGIPGKSKAETKPEYKRNFFRIDPKSDSLTIIINVSNFHHRRGGFWLPMTLGTFNEVQKRLANSWGFDSATISLLLGFSVFFLFFFLMNPKEKIMGFFSIVTIGLALRPLFTSHFLILNMIDLDWSWIIRFEYLGLFMIILGGTWFTDSLYPSKFIRALSFAISAIFLLFAVLTMLLPVKIFSYFILIFYPTVIILLIYILYRSLRGILNRSLLDLIYLMAFILLLFGAINDIRVSLGQSQTLGGYSLTYIIVLFVFIQAGLLLYKYFRSIYEKDKLQKELEFMNSNLEQIINERTQELKNRNEEIEKQNTRIALQNKQLSDTIQLKNKVFSVISHDLRSPVVNILYLLNLLKEKKYKDKHDSFANSSILYAQQVISLLENMLIWGRGQEDKIKYSPEKLNLADIILANLSIFKETADNKEIAVNFTREGNLIAFFDKDLIDIIIRNLLSNAVKYTFRGGRISILLKDMPVKGEGILLKICDNGVGIPASKLKDIFSETDIASTPGTENEKGTGLGLKLCHELVMINKGKISVESKEDEGTCFSIILPDDKIK